MNDAVAHAGWLLPRSDARPLPRAVGVHLQSTLARFTESASLLAPEALPAHRRVERLLRELGARDPKGLRHVLSSPTVATPLQCAPLAEALPAQRERIVAAVREVPARVLLELALRGNLPGDEALEWPAAPSLASPALGVRLEPPADATALRFGPRELSAKVGSAWLPPLRLGEGGPGDAAHGFEVSPAWVRVGRLGRLALGEHNPIASFEAHPDKSGNPVDLGGKSAQQWCAALDEALELIAAHLPELHAEMGSLLVELVPVGYDEVKHLSASYREALGTVYLTLHPQLMTMAEALIHEYQHNKLNLASYALEHLHNAFEPRYRSPVRPDPRPLWGILLAVHAFLPVAALYRAMRAAKHPLTEKGEFERRLRDIDTRNHEGMEMLRAHAQWTPAGSVLWRELDAMDRAHVAEWSSRGDGLDAATAAHEG